MRKKRLIGGLLAVMVALTFSVSALTVLGVSDTGLTVNPLAFSVYTSQVNVNSVKAKPSSFNLTINFKTYYIQESGDLMMFMVFASTPSGIIPGMALGNGTTGWHFVPLDWYTPSVSIKNIDGNVTLFIYGALMKNVWPSGWRTVDECFGLVGLFNPVNNATSLVNLVTANGNMHMIMFLDVIAS
ncbi:MAG: hypothetical protein ACTSSA_07230 [Candidatus Freyarchaeota archaeon]|nr:hypothetical protein [Candidatus Freyarchaeota archaeon]